MFNHVLLKSSVPSRYAHINFTPPKSVREEAKRGLLLRRKHGRGGLSTQQANQHSVGSGVQRAVTLASGSRVSPSTVKRMRSFFARHSAYKEHHTDKTSAAYISWLLWGGDAGETWANKVYAQMVRADDLLKKAGEQAGHKYIRRIPVARRGRMTYRYIYQQDKERTEKQEGDIEQTTTSSSVPADLTENWTTEQVAQEIVSNPQLHDRTFKDITEAPKGEMETAEGAVCSVNLNKAGDGDTSNGCGATNEHRVLTASLEENGQSELSSAVQSVAPLQEFDDDPSNTEQEKATAVFLPKIPIARAVALLVLKLAIQAYKTITAGDPNAPSIATLENTVDRAYSNMERSAVKDAREKMRDSLNKDREDSRQRERQERRKERLEAEERRERRREKERQERRKERLEAEERREKRRKMEKEERAKAEARREEKKQMEKEERRKERSEAEARREEKKQMEKEERRKERSEAEARREEKKQIEKEERTKEREKAEAQREEKKQKEKEERIKEREKAEAQREEKKQKEKEERTKEREKVEAQREEKKQAEKREKRERERLAELMKEAERGIKEQEKQAQKEFEQRLAETEKQRRIEQAEKENKEKEDAKIENQQRREEAKIESQKRREEEEERRKREREHKATLAREEREHKAKLAREAREHSASLGQVPKRIPRKRIKRRNKALTLEGTQAEPAIDVIKKSRVRRKQNKQQKIRKSVAAPQDRGHNEDTP